jgi:hypothetical protein
MRLIRKISCSEGIGWPALSKPARIRSNLRVAGDNALALAWGKSTEPPAIQTTSLISRALVIENFFRLFFGRDTF